MRHLAAVALLFAVSSQSQTVTPPPATPPPLVEKIDVSVVNVDVTVTNQRGDTVPGLTRDDFEIDEDGVRQPISNFYSVENASALPEATRAATTEAAPAPAPERFRRKVLVLVDSVNSTVRGRNEALAKLETFIKDHFDDGRYDWSIAMVDSRVHLILPMTSDKKVLHDAVAEIRLSPSRKEMRAATTASDFSRTSNVGVNPTPLRDNPPPEDSVSNFREESNLAEQMMFAHSSTNVIVDAARAFGTTEGRKIILLVTGQLPMGHVMPVDRIGGDNKSKLGNHIQTLTSADRELSTMREQLVREANASNTSFYIIAADGLETPEQEVVHKNFGAPPARSNAYDTSPMYWLANETGGAYMPGNRMEQAFADFDRRSSTFYSLGYRPQHPDDNRYHHLAVRVKGHSEYHLQYRDGYSSEPADKQLVRTLTSSLGASMQPSTMTMSLIIGEPQYQGVVAVVPIKAEMTKESLQYLTDACGSRTRLHMYVSIFDRDGRNLKLTKSFADVIIGPDDTTTGPMTLTIKPLSLPRGTYRIVVAVRDELTDKVAVVQQRVDV
jgi:VWFA-related protein